MYNKKITHFIFILFTLTVTYSVKVYGPDTDTENIGSLAVRIGGEDGAQTELKYLPNRRTQGYEMFILSAAEHKGPRSVGAGGGDFGYHHTCLWIQFMVGTSWHVQ